MVCYKYNPKTGMNERIISICSSRSKVRKDDKVVDASSFRQRDDLVRHFMATGKINSTAQLVYDNDNVDPVFGDLRSKKLDIVDREQLAASAQADYEQKVSRAEKKTKAMQESAELDEEFKKIQRQINKEDNKGSA